MDIKSIISELNCFTELHLHLDGSVSVKSARELADIENIILPESDEELKDMLMVSEDCSDLNEYLEKFSLPVSLMQSEKSIEKAAYNLCCELKSLGLMYAEIRFAPQKHCEKGASQDMVVRAAINGIEKSGFDAQLILCCMRDGSDNSMENMETVKLTEKYLGRGVCACDLAGAEALFPNSKYLYVFEEAARLNVPYTVHSGEALGYESVIEAVENGAHRIGHGVRAAENHEAMELLVKRHVPVEVCPTSNINTCVFKRISDIPLRYFMDRGVNVTVSSDNMSVSATNIKNEYLKLAESFELSLDEIRLLLENSVKAAFTDESHKDRLMEIISAEFGRYSGEYDKKRG